MIKERLRSAYQRIRSTVEFFLEDDGSRLAAEASFYLIFSLFPLLFLMVLLLGSFGSSLLVEAPNESLVTTFDSILPRATYQTLVNQLQRMVEHYRPSHFLITVVIFLWPASTVFQTYLTATNLAYGFPERRSYLNLRVNALFVLLVSGTLLFTSFLIIGLAPLILSWLETYLLPIGLLRLFLFGRFVGAILFIAPSLALIYRYGPNTDQPDQLIVWPGAFFATITWILFTQLFGLYLRYVDNIHLLYGTLGGGMLLLLWMYLSSIAVIAGAEYNYVLMKETENNKRIGQQTD